MTYKKKRFIYFTILEEVAIILESVTHSWLCHSTVDDIMVGSIWEEEIM